MSEANVRVAVRIRPFLPKEVLHNHQMCTRLGSDSGQVMVGADRVFSFDYVYGPTASQVEVYQSSVHPLVQSLIDGYNATVFCYGQTGSGKTYTLGGGKLHEDGGIIEHVAQNLFLFLEEKIKNGVNIGATVLVSYLELYMEKLRDLLELPTIEKQLYIRDDENGNTVVMGAKDLVINSAEELLSVVEMGNALRHTYATGMNEASSRSHTVLTIQVNQICKESAQSSSSSKFCLVDLAGSECAAKTGNTGINFKESIHINTGLLALGNVICALADSVRLRHNNPNGIYIPYRNAKITRLLRESLGGTTQTLMIACVSPSHHSITETMSVMFFASKARDIRNHLRGITNKRDANPKFKNNNKTPPRDLENDKETLKELTKEKPGGIEEDVSELPDRQDKRKKDKKVNQDDLLQCYLLVQEAAALLVEIPGPGTSPSFKQQLQKWQERLTTVSHLDQHCNSAILKLREENNTSKESLTINKHLLEQKDAELRRAHKQIERCIQENRSSLEALEEEKKRSRLATEQFLEQQILISHLRSNLLTFRASSAEARASVPLMRRSRGRELTRSAQFSPSAYSLERVLASFKMRNHVLLVENEEIDGNYNSFIKQPAEIKVLDEEGVEEEEDDTSAGRRHSLNQTWTTLKKSDRADQACNGITEVQQSQEATRSSGICHSQKSMKAARIQASATQRRIWDLSVNMRMKEDLLKELNKTDKATKAVDKHGRYSGDGRGVLENLSLHSQKIQDEVYHSLQNMSLQRAELQATIKQYGETSEDSKDQYLEQCSDVPIDRTINQRGSYEKPVQLYGSCWLEKEEERELQRRAELRELEDEWKRRNEVLLHKETCVQQKNMLETKMLRSSQALSQDLLQVSMCLDSLERRSREWQPGGLSTSEQEEKRDVLKKKKEVLETQLKDNRVLTVEEEHSLLQLEEASEVLEAALEFKNHSIRDRQRKLFITNSSSHQPQRAEPPQPCNVIRRLKGLSAAEASELLIKYFNKVVCLREVEQQLCLRCEELELLVEEKEMMMNQLEEDMKRLTLDADRRLTELHRDHQISIQQLLQKLKEGTSGEAQQATDDRIQQLVKETFFYKSSCRDLKKKLKECLRDPSQFAGHTPLQGQTQNTQTHMSSKESHGEVQTRTTRGTYMKIDTEQGDKNACSDSDLKRRPHQTAHSPSASQAQTHKKRDSPEYSLTQCKDSNGSGDTHRLGSAKGAVVRLQRRDLRQVSSTELQTRSAAACSQQPARNSITESVLEDSIDVARNT